MTRGRNTSGIPRFAAAAGTAALLACVANASLAAPHGAVASDEGFAVTTGEALYANICQGCHMEGGKGAEEVGQYPALVGNAKIASQVYVMQMVMYGNRGMPGFAGFLDDEQIAEVVDYVRHDLGDNDYPGELAASAVDEARDSKRTDPLE